MVEVLKDLMKDAEEGKLISFMLIGQGTGGDTIGCQAGEIDLAEILVAFEDWKFRRLFNRNMEII